jgi:hypothetical protein
LCRVADCKFGSFTVIRKSKIKASFDNVSHQFSANQKEETNEAYPLFVVKLEKKYMLFAVHSIFQVNFTGFVSLFFRSNAVVFVLTGTGKEYF